MPASETLRRQPMQARSRRTVEQILNAAEAIIGESGVDAATTRLISERAGVSPPSLYRFFADRDEIFDAVLERGLIDLDMRAESAVLEFHGDSIERAVRLAVEVHVDYYEQHPSFVRLWYGGRVSKRVVEEVHARNTALAELAHNTLMAAGLIERNTPIAVLLMLVELGDRAIDLAFRGRRRADRDAVELAVTALTAFLERVQSRADVQPHA